MPTSGYSCKLFELIWYQVEKIQSLSSCICHLSLSLSQDFHVVTGSLSDVENLNSSWGIKCANIMLVIDCKIWRDELLMFGLNLSTWIIIVTVSGCDFSTSGGCLDTGFHVNKLHWSIACKQANDIGFMNSLFQVEVTDAALLALIENYCREAGVRNLQKQIEKIYRKVLLSVLFCLKHLSCIVWIWCIVNFWRKVDDYLM